MSVSSRLHPSTTGGQMMAKEFSSQPHTATLSNTTDAYHSTSTASAPLPSATTFRIHLTGPGGGASTSHSSQANVGPASYEPSTTLTTTASPRTKFGMADRFTNSKVGYISPRHNSDLLCTASPGPKYHIVPTSATYPRSPALSWGDKQSLDDRAKRNQLLASESTDVGPGGYTPKHANIKPTAPRCAFARSERFGGPFGSYQTLNNSSQGATMYAPSIDATVASSPRFSFGNSNKGETSRDVRHKPRTSFMTHSIRGGLAKPATLECNVGPGDYYPFTGDIGQLSARQVTVRNGFGSSQRFLKAGIQYISPAHAMANVGQASPGPKYMTTTINQPKSPRTSGLKWVP